MQSESYVQWLRENGCKFEKLQLQQLPLNNLSVSRGVIAISSISASAAFLRVPEKLIIYPKRCILLSPALKTAVEKFPKFFEGNEEVILIVFLMEEHLKGDESFWYPYLEQLPIPSTPITWNNKDRARLQCPSLEEIIESMEQKVKTLYRNAFVERLFEMQVQKCQSEMSNSETIRQNFSAVSKHSVLDIFYDPSRFSLSLFQWAWDVVQTRSFGRFLPWMALVPLADNLNHSSDISIAYKLDTAHDGQRFFQMATDHESSFMTGAEVFNSYGQRSNAHLIRYYGFALECNKWDEVNIEIFPNPMPPLTDSENVQLSSRIHLSGDVHTRELKRRILDHFYPVSMPITLRWGTMCHQLLSCCRVAVLSDREICERENQTVTTPLGFDFIGDKDGQSQDEVSRNPFVWEKFYFQPINVTNERAALQEAISILTFVIEGYATSIHDDDVELASLHNTNSPKIKEEIGHQLAAITFRKSQKHLLNNHIKLFSGLLAVVDAHSWPLSTSNLTEQRKAHHLLDLDKIGEYFSSLSHLRKAKREEI